MGSKSSASAPAPQQRPPTPPLSVAPPALAHHAEQVEAGLAEAAAVAADPSVDVGNSTNNTIRWASAINAFRELSSGSKARKEAEQIVIGATIDISGSMAGRKLTAVKLGLCAVVAQLEPTDLFYLSCFDDKIDELTSGFITIGEACERLPTILAGVETDGSTALYDAVIKGLGRLHEVSVARSAPAGEEGSSAASGPRHVFVALTDGEDNASTATASRVLEYLKTPGMNKFMFVSMFVELSSSTAAAMSSWFELRHCKRVNATVRSGATLVKAFSEVLMSKVLFAESDSTRMFTVGAPEAELYRAEDEDVEEYHCYSQSGSPVYEYGGGSPVLGGSFRGSPPYSDYGSDSRTQTPPPLPQGFEPSDSVDSLHAFHPSARAPRGGSPTQELEDSQTSTQPAFLPPRGVTEEDLQQAAMFGGDGHMFYARSAPLAAPPPPAPVAAPLAPAQVSSDPELEALAMFGGDGPAWHAYANRSRREDDATG